MDTVKINLDHLIGLRMASLGQPITIKEISEATGISQNRLIDYRKGRADTIKLETIARLCNYFNCQPGDLFTLEKE